MEAVDHERSAFHLSLELLRMLRVDPRLTSEEIAFFAIYLSGLAMKLGEAGTQVTRCVYLPVTGMTCS